MTSGCGLRSAAATRGSDPFLSLATGTLSQLYTEADFPENPGPRAAAGLSFECMTILLSSDLLPVDHCFSHAAVCFFFFLFLQSSVGRTQFYNRLLFYLLGVIVS